MQIVKAQIIWSSNKSEGSKPNGNEDKVTGEQYIYLSLNESAKDAVAMSSSICAVLFLHGYLGFEVTAFKESLMLLTCNSPFEFSSFSCVRKWK